MQRRSSDLCPLIVGLALFVYTSSSLAKEPLLLMTDDGPPHIVQETDGGIDIEITKRVLLRLNYKAAIAYAPLARGLLLVEHGEADLTVPTFFQRDSDNLFFSDAIIAYRPTVFSLKEYQFRFNDFADINNLNVSTFQGATGYFGPEFEAMTHVTNYTEHHDMSTLPSFLLQKKTDLVVLDYYIFYYFLRQHHTDSALGLIQVHPLIPPVTAHVGFHSKALRDAFNKELYRFLQEGRDKAIIRQYIGNVE